MIDFTDFSGGKVVWDGGILEIFIYVRNVWESLCVRVRYIITDSWKCSIVISD